MAKNTPAVERLELGPWEFFQRPSGQPGCSASEVTGKYLFFCKDRERLVEIAQTELSEGPYSHAKIPMPGENLHSEYVLCLYHKDDGLKRELASKYKSEEGLKYRYWKSNKATAEQQYSEEFLSELPPEIRKRFED